MISNPICIRVKGPFACFTRPEFKVERVSYPVITPSAARGVFEAILMKPIEKPDPAKRHDKVGFRWVITRIGVVERGTLFSIKRNELKSEEGDAANLRDGLGKNKHKIGYNISDSSDHYQRNSLILTGRLDRESDQLHEIEYLLEARIYVPEFSREDCSDALTKYERMFERHARHGSCFYQPFFGCREFSLSSWELVSRKDIPEKIPDASQSEDFGKLFFDFDYDRMWNHWPEKQGYTYSERPFEWPDLKEQNPVSPERVPAFSAVASHGWIDVPTPKDLENYA